LLKGDEAIKDDDMARLIFIKVFLSRQASRHLATVDIPILSWKDL